MGNDVTNRVTQYRESVSETLSPSQRKRNPSNPPPIREKFVPGYYRLLKQKNLSHVIVRLVKVERQGEQIIRGFREDGTAISLYNGALMKEDLAEFIGAFSHGQYVISAEKEVTLRDRCEFTGRALGVAPSGSVVRVVETRENQNALWGKVESGGWLQMVDFINGNLSCRFIDGKNDILKEGWLEKQGWYVKSWRTRWFLLRSDGILEYYTDETLEILKGCIYINEKCQILPFHEQKRFGFVVKEEKRDWFLGARNDQDRQTWVSILSNLIIAPGNISAEDRRTKMRSQISLDDYDDLLEESEPGHDRGNWEPRTYNLDHVAEIRKHNETVAGKEVLPPGWEKCIDYISGCPFYVDHTTQTTHWELPDTHGTSAHRDTFDSSSSLVEPVVPADVHRQSIAQIENLDSRLQEVTAEKEKLEKMVEHLEEEKNCVICMEQPKSVVVIPCGHYSFCKECADELESGQECPICRKTIVRVIEVHESSII